MSRRDDVHLFIPGPAGADPEVLEVLAQPIVPHYGPKFVAEYNLCREQFKRALRTRNDLYLIVGPGTAALDAAMASALPDGSRVLVPSNGWFGQRVASMCRAHRAEVELMEFAPGEAIDAAAVTRRIQTEPRLAAVAWVHHETSTGVLNPVEPIAQAARGAGVLTIIDAVSSLGGTELAVDDWGVDLCVSVSNKGLAAPAGLAGLSVSEQAWRAVDANPDTRSWYLDLRTWRKYDGEWGDWHPYPTTVPSGLVAALNVSFRKILDEEGLETRIARTRAAADRVRSELRSLGFSMFSPDECASPITTAVHAHPDLGPAELVTRLRDGYGIYISGGLDELAGKIFRIGHMGSSIEETEIDRLVAAISEILRGAALQEESASVEGASA